MIGCATPAFTYCVGRAGTTCDSTPWPQLAYAVVSGEISYQLPSGVAVPVTPFTLQPFERAMLNEVLSASAAGSPQTVRAALQQFIARTRADELIEAGYNAAIEALEHLEAHRGSGDPGADLVLTDVYLKGELSGHDLLDRLRGDFGYGKRRLPVLVMTSDANPENQSGLLRAGANDLVLKPIEERLLVTKALFQLRLAQLPASSGA